MRQFAFFALLTALVAPVAADSMELFDSGIAKSALDFLPSAKLNPSLALFGAALCGVFALGRSSRA